jgi:hypothetical protein
MELDVELPLAPEGKVQINDAPAWPGHKYVLVDAQAPFKLPVNDAGTVGVPTPIVLERTGATSPHTLVNTTLMLPPVKPAKKFTVMLLEVELPVQLAGKVHA